MAYSLGRCNSLKRHEEHYPNMLRDGAVEVRNECGRLSKLFSVCVIRTQIADLEITAVRLHG